MGAQLRVYRGRIRSVKATKKITKAMELIASSRIVKAQQRVAASLPYTKSLVAAVTAAASHGETSHPLTSRVQNPKRAAVCLITSDRGLAGGYSTNAIKEAEGLNAYLREQGIVPVAYLVGRKGVSFYKFRERKIAESWTGFTDQPTYEDARAIAEALLEAFVTPTEEGGVDEIHLVFTEFKNMVVQRPLTKQLLPLQVEESELGANDADEVFPLYEFEPEPEDVLDALLPQYITNVIWNALLLSAASEHAARRRAMKSATDNAEEMIRNLTRLANQARQAEITQEISEIVGGADALASK
jgi:F-type H+-transporting ATPase subunit gamma